LICSCCISKILEAISAMGECLLRLLKRSNLGMTTQKKRALSYQPI
jgi:hypothetical protein